MNDVRIESDLYDWYVSADMNGFGDLTIEVGNKLVPDSVTTTIRIKNPTKRELQDIGLMFIGLANNK